MSHRKRQRELETAKGSQIALGQGGLFDEENA